MARTVSLAKYIAGFRKDFTMATERKKEIDMKTEQEMKALVKEAIEHASVIQDKQDNDVHEINAILISLAEEGIFRMRQGCNAMVNSPVVIKVLSDLGYNDKELIDAVYNDVAYKKLSDIWKQRAKKILNN